jgi:hypothetical protein
MNRVKGPRAKPSRHRSRLRGDLGLVGPNGGHREVALHWRHVENSSSYARFEIVDNEAVDMCQVVLADLLRGFPFGKWKNASEPTASRIEGSAVSADVSRRSFVHEQAFMSGCTSYP